MLKRPYVILLIVLILMGYSSVFGWYYKNIPNNQGKELIVSDTTRSLAFYVDPLLLRAEKPQTQFLVVLENFEAQRLLEQQLMSSGYKVLHKYKLIPALFVEGEFYGLLEIAKRFSGAINGVYANRLYSLPKYFVVPAQVAPTTNHTAYLTGANLFWERNYKGENIKVAVIDTGINKDHPELSGKVVAEKSFVLTYYGYSSDVPSPSDENGHGTACAGIIAGKGLDPRGQGMAPNALLMNARVFPRTGGATLAAIIAAIEWSALGPDYQPNTGDEADVINMSLGGGGIYNCPIWLAIKKATELGVVVCIAAGNEGDNQIGSMSVGNPGDAPWAITVGATDPYYSGLDYVGSGALRNEYTSIGPTILYAVKPDIAAPSGTLVLSLGGGYTGTAWHGTSFSSPHVAGFAALLVDYLRKHNVSKPNMPWIVKTVLMVTAIPLNGTYASQKVKYEDLIVGAGAVSMRNALNLLENSAISGSDYPQWIYILPTKVPVGISNSTAELHKPYFPYFDKVFNRQTIFMNFTIITSRPTTMNISFYGNFTNALIIHSSTSLSIDEPSKCWEFNFTVREDTPEGFYNGEIIFRDTTYNLEKRIPISFLVEKPKLRVLLDLKHTDWSIDIKYGQFRLLFANWEKLGASIDTLPFGFGTKLSSEILSKYDLLFMPDTVSAVPIFDEIGRIPGYEFQTTRIWWEEILSIYKFIKDGGSLITFALDAFYHNITNINELLKPTGSYLYNLSWDGAIAVVSAETEGNHIIIKDVLNLPYYGILVYKGFPSEAFLKYSGYKLAIIHQGFAGGYVMALGSNFMFDNWAFCGQYPGSQYVPTFAKNIIEMAANWSKILDEIRIVNAEYIKYGSSIIFIDKSLTSLNLTTTNSTPLMSVTWELSAGDKNLTGEFTYDSTSRQWTTTIDISTITTSELMIKVKASFEVSGTTYYVVRAGTIMRDFSPPTAILEPDNIVIGPNASVKTSLKLLDDTAVNITSLYLALNISEYSIKTSMMDMFSYKLDIEIPNSLIMQMYSGGYKIISVTISVRVEDLFGKLGQEEKILKVYIDDEPPTITILAPAEGEYLRGTIGISVRASDALSGISSISLYVDNYHRQTIAASQYVFKLDTTKYPDGVHIISIKSTDNVGNIGWKNITVYFDNTAPKITIQGITNGSILRGNVTFNVSASDNMLIQNVTVYIDGTVLAKTTESKLTIQLDTTTCKNGKYIVKVEAYDKAGNKGIAIVQVTINNVYPIPAHIIAIAAAAVVAVAALVMLKILKKPRKPAS
ncbi:MAG: S8 family serine peptidase [Candidatus Korarchaeota archaeon]|nr:S8 family serine peptidase [Thermoproteota archaeon]